jgi:hypothetical protein
MIPDPTTNIWFQENISYITKDEIFFFDNTRKFWIPLTHLFIMLCDLLSNDNEQVNEKLKLGKIRISLEG